MTFGQAGQWTWVHGDSACCQTAVYGTIGVFAPTNTAGAIYEACEWTDQQGKFWLLDNYDLWQYDPTINQWAWMKGPMGVMVWGVHGTKGVGSPSNYPGYREKGTATWTDNNGDLWRFGGLGMDSLNNFGYKNDLWKYDIGANEWTWVKGSNGVGVAPTFGTKGVSTLSNTPGGKFETSATWIDSNGDLWLFGGVGLDSLSSVGAWNDLWVYDIPTNEWTWISGDNFINPSAVYGTKGVPSITNKPSGRYCYNRWIENDNLWLFGGQMMGGLKLNDLWRYNISTTEWTWVSGSDTTYHPGVYGEKCIPSLTMYPSARNESRSTWTDQNGNFWLFGGIRFSSLNDLWVFNSTTTEWTWVFGDTILNPPSNHGKLLVSSPTNDPGGKNGPVGWADTLGNLWLFAGQAGSPYNDLWKFEIDPNCNGITGITEFQQNFEFQIVPNPFDQTTTVIFYLDNSEEVTIELSDLLGQQVQTLSKGDRPIGRNEVTIDTDDLSAGIYILTIRLGDYFKSEKILKTKY